MRSLSVAATGMMTQQLHVEVISNNIANMTTTGYKRRRAEFQDLLYQNQRRIGSTSSAEGTVVPAGVQLGLGVKTAAVYRIHDQGEFVNSKNSFDLAIQGNGYFVVELPTGELAYTRSGNFQISPEGQLVTPDGYMVSPGVTVPEDAVEVSINQEGLIAAKIAGEVEEQELGQLQLATFVNEAGLEATGSNLLQETAASGPALAGPPGTEGLGTVLQGFLESSNVTRRRRLQP
jgi:flagellar basal-body rod protein FlgG